ncbi:MAG: hypothetical protein R2734_07945 [Nocardioides sp.]
MAEILAPPARRSTRWSEENSPPSRSAAGASGAWSGCSSGVHRADVRPDQGVRPTTPTRTPRLQE